MGICGGLAYGITGNAGKVGLRAIVGENDDVVGFVTDNDLEVCGEVRVIFNPYTELSIGGYYDFIRDVLTSEGGCAARPLREEGIGQGQGFVLRQTQVAVLGVDKKQGFARR